MLVVVTCKWWSADTGMRLVVPRTSTNYAHDSFSVHRPLHHVSNSQSTCDLWTTISKPFCLQTNSLAHWLSVRISLFITNDLISTAIAVVIVVVCPMQCTNHLSSCMSVCLSLYVCPKYLSSSIATAVFVRSSSNFECKSHIWQRRPSSMASNTGSNIRAWASCYFRFSSFLSCVHNVAPISCPIFFIKFGT